MAADDTAGVVTSTATGLAGAGVAGPVERPGRVDVAREDQRATAALAAGRAATGQAGPLGGVAVPLVVVQHAAVEDGVAVRQQRVDPAQRAAATSSSISFTTTPLAITAHGRLSSASRSASQRALLVAEERALRIVEVRRPLVAGLAVAPLEAGVEEQELGQVADRRPTATW